MVVERCASKGAANCDVCIRRDGGANPAATEQNLFLGCRAGGAAC
jgi:hypothetical protein